MRNITILFIVWIVVLHITICYQSGDVADQLNTFAQQSDTEYTASVDEAAHAYYEEEPFDDDLEENEPYEYQRTSALRSPPIPVPQSVPEPESTDEVRYRWVPQPGEEMDLSTSEGNSQESQESPPKEQLKQEKEKISPEKKSIRQKMLEALRKTIAALKF